MNENKPQEQENPLHLVHMWCHTILHQYSSRKDEGSEEAEEIFDFALI